MVNFTSFSSSSVYATSCKTTKQDANQQAEKETLVTQLAAATISSSLTTAIVPIRNEEEALFKITKSTLESGLRGVPVGYCSTSFIDPIKGIFYRGKPIKELASKSPEEVIYLILYGKEGSATEFEQFKKELENRATVSEEVLAHIRQLPKQANPMKLFAMSLLIAATYDKTTDYRESCLNSIAQVPVIVAHIINHHAGWESSIPSNPKLGYIENFVSMLGMPNKQKGLVEAMKLFNILHYDHGGGNLSTFVGKAIASGLEDMYGALSGAMCALAGPRHGGANSSCYNFVKETTAAINGDFSEKLIEKQVQSRLATGELVYGFGHAVLRVEDPRATIFYEFAEKNYSDHPLVRTAALLRKTAPKILPLYTRISCPYPNVDAISGVTLDAAGFAYPQYFTLLFAMSRVVGIARQIVYERLEARGSKGTPIMRPKYLSSESTNGKSG